MNTSVLPGTAIGWLPTGVGYGLQLNNGSDVTSEGTVDQPIYFARYTCVQEVANYEKDHHSQTDTLDRLRWDDLAEGAQVLAIYAYNVAQLPEMLPRKPAPAAQNATH